MPIGTVKWFNAERGYGFITPHEAGPDVFVHQYHLNLSRLDNLEPGMCIEYELRCMRRDPTKIEAVNLREPEGAVR